MSQVHFYVSSHTVIVVTKIIRPLSACVVPWMLVHECFSPCQRGEYGIVKPGYCKLSHLLQDWTPQVKQKLWASVARLRVASLQKPPLALKIGDILAAETDNKRQNLCEKIWEFIVTVQSLLCWAYCKHVGSEMVTLSWWWCFVIIIAIPTRVVVKPWLARDSCG